MTWLVTRLSMLLSNIVWIVQGGWGDDCIPDILRPEQTMRSHDFRVNQLLRNVLTTNNPLFYAARVLLFGVNLELGVK